MPMLFPGQWMPTVNCCPAALRDVKGDLRHFDLWPLERHLCFLWSGHRSIPGPFFRFPGLEA